MLYSLAATLSALPLAALIAFAAPIATERYRRRQDRRLTANALAGATQAILTRTRDWKYDDLFRARLRLLEQGERVVFRGAIAASPRNDPIWERYQDRIGLLPPDIGNDVQNFFGIIACIRDDLARLYAGNFDDDPAAATSLLRAVLEMWDIAQALGVDLIARLGKIH